VDGNGDPIPDNENTETDDGDGTSDGDPTNDPTVTTLAPAPGMELIKSVTGVTAAGAAGALDDVIEYTFTVENTGNVTLTGVTVDDALTGSVDLAVTPGTLAPGQTGTATATYVILQSDVDAGGVENSATAEGSSPGNTGDVGDDSDTGTAGDGSPVGDPATEETPDNDDINGDNNDGDPTNDPTPFDIAADPELTVTKTVTTAGSALNDVIGYDIVVTNTGNVTLTDIEVTDANADAGSIVGSPIASLDPGQSATVTAQQTIQQSDLDAG
ncbi:hypothetical protein ACFQ1M_17685, partial [Sungkyunkwania multivorans]